MENLKFDVTKGNRDWYGAEALLRNRISNTLRSIFESYGFEPIETPIVESKDAIAFKGGGEIQKEVFQLKDQGKRELALRFDQTVPLARFVATHQDIKFPFKRYVIGPVFRDGPTQPEQGRYRQFTQCDVDVLGVKEMTAEAELFGLAQDAFGALGLGGVDVKINNRKLLDGVLDYAGVPEYARLRTISTLDKMDKIGIEGVREALAQLTFSEKPTGLKDDTLRDLIFLAETNSEMALEQYGPQVRTQVGNKGYEEVADLVRSTKDKAELYSILGSYGTNGEILLTPDNVSKLLDVIQTSGDNESTFARLAGAVQSEKGREGLAEVRQLLDYSRKMGFDFISLDPSLARGLDYYTGTTIEVFLKDRKIVSSAILAGGRFDDMVGDFRGGVEIPAVGFSFGLERLVMILGSQEQNAKKTNTNIYLIPMGTADACLKIAHDLRKSGVNVDMELQSGMKMGKSISYADSKGIQYVGIVGENELKDGTVAVKDLRTRKQESVRIGDVAAYLSSQGK